MYVKIKDFKIFSHSLFKEFFLILVFGVLSTAAASTYFFQPASSSLNVFDEGGNINWSDLFDSIEQYNPGSHVEMYTHSGDTAGGETALNGPANSGGFFAGQGLSLDPWSGVSGHEKFSAVVAALAGGPSADASELAPQWFDLADAAAFAVAVLIKTEQALFLDEGFQLALVRRDQFDVDLVELTHLLDKPVGLRVQAAGIEAEHFDVLVQLPGHVHQHHILGAAERDPQVVAELAECQLEDVLGGFVGIGRGEFSDIEGLVHQHGSCRSVALSAL